jgi:hypothetical protein
MADTVTGAGFNDEQSTHGFYVVGRIPLYGE